MMIMHRGPVMTQEKLKNLPDYSRPPINEVVCGIHFEHLHGLLNPFLGILWDKYKPEYKNCLEVPPLMPIIESFDTRSLQVRGDFDLPQLPRTWFVHSNENEIIQIQRDRFLHNWREVRPEDIYPRYKKIIEVFQKHLST